MSKGSKYSDQDRLRAVQEYHRCGSLAEVSESTGIPRKTLGDWFRTGWWDELLAEVRRDDGEPVSSSGEVGEPEKNKVDRPTSYKADLIDETQEYVEQVPQTRLVHSGSQYTDVERRRAVAVYCATGNISETSRITSIPRGTIQGWTETEWWVSEQSRVQQQITEQIRAQNMQIATNAGIEILDRITNGDTQIVQGEQVRVPMKGRDLSIVSGIAVDKTIQLGLPQAINAKGETMEELMKKFERAAIESRARIVSEQ